MLATTNNGAIAPLNPFFLSGNIPRYFVVGDGIDEPFFSMRKAIDCADRLRADGVRVQIQAVA